MRLLIAERMITAITEVVIIILITLTIITYKANSIKKTETLTWTRNWSGKYVWIYFWSKVTSTTKKIVEKKRPKEKKWKQWDIYYLQWAFLKVRLAFWCYSAKTESIPSVLRKSVITIPETKKKKETSRTFPHPMLT